MGSRQGQERIVRLAVTTGLSGVESAATSLGPHAGHSLRERPHEALDAKRGIARWAVQQIRPGETIMLDTGSAVAALAHELRPAHNLTVATASLAVLQELAGAESIHVECLGGTLRRASQSCVGPLAEAALERITFDRAFLGADGITAENGICAGDLQQTRLKELVARRTDQTYVLAPSAALGRRPFHAWAPLPPGWTLVTDASAEAASLAPFRAHDADVIVVDAQGLATAEV
jgi:DeoR/GlpR family transcriptional regulator of sugar metabolism